MRSMALGILNSLDTNNMRSNVLDYREYVVLNEGKNSFKIDLKVLLGLLAKRGTDFENISEIHGYDISLVYPQNTRVLIGKDFIIGENGIWMWYRGIFLKGNGAYTCYPFVAYGVCLPVIYCKGFLHSFILSIDNVYEGCIACQCSKGEILRRML